MTIGEEIRMLDEFERQLNNIEEFVEKSFFYDTDTEKLLKELDRLTRKHTKNRQ